MYLNSVLENINNRTAGKYTAEDLYKLNEAIFNLPEMDVVNQKITGRLFSTLQTIAKSYGAGRFKHHDSFFYDYVALMGTMQNQHFFNDKQNTSILSWLYEAIDDEIGTQVKPAGGKGAKGGAVPAQAAKQIARLEAENQAMQKELAQLRELSSAVVALKQFKLPEQPKTRAKSNPKSKGQGRNRKPPADDDE